MGSRGDMAGLGLAVIVGGFGGFSGSLTLSAPAGLNSVLPGTPLDEPETFAPSVAHPRGRDR